MRDDERLARFCDESAVKTSGVVKYRAFLATKFPCELSVDRIELCKPEERAARETIDFKRRRTFVVFVASAARAIPRVAIHAKPMARPEHDRDAPEHAEVHISHDSPSRMLETKDALMADEKIWKQHVDCCSELANISRARDCDKPNSN